MKKLISALGFLTLALPAWSLPLCSPTKRAEVLAPATEANPSVKLDCNLNLTSADVITKFIVIEGSEVSGLVLKCSGATLDGRVKNPGKDMIMVRSNFKNGNWSRPSDITIKGCNVYGSIRIYGMGTNGESDKVKESSHSLGHTERAQKAAPTYVTLYKMNIYGQSRIPLYFSPGVTYSKLLNSKIRGVSDSTAIYLDAESAHNEIRYNDIMPDTTRELIAIDGSAHNVIAGNYFSNLNDGGIYLYRNCGEGGTVRHQPPQHNDIGNNFFLYKKYHGSNPSVYLASRNGDRNYCDADKGYNFGSSIDNKDLARNNRILKNRIMNNDPSKFIKQNDKPNTVSGNIRVSGFPGWDRKASYEPTSLSGPSRLYYLKVGELSP